MRLAIIRCLSVFLLTSPLHAQTEPSVTTVQTGGVQAVLIKPAKPIGSIILLAGGDGRIGVEAGGVITRQGNQLVRTRMAYARKGFAVLVPDRGYELAPLVELMKGVKGPVTVVGTSRGTQWAAEGIAAGARPDKLVLTSGFLSEASTGEPPGRARPREEKTPSPFWEVARSCRRRSLCITGRINAGSHPLRASLPSSPGRRARRR